MEIDRLHSAEGAFSRAVRDAKDRENTGDAPVVDDIALTGLSDGGREYKKISPQVMKESPPSETSPVIASETVKDSSPPDDVAPPFPTAVSLPDPKESPYAGEIRELYDRDFKIYVRDKEEGYRELDLSEACAEAALLTPRKKPGTRIFFRDGRAYYEIDREKDLERALALLGIKDESMLSEDERKALTLAKGMMAKGAIFVEKEMENNKPREVGLLSILKAVDSHLRGVNYLDSSMRRSEVRALKDLERISFVYYRDNQPAISPRERSLIRQTLDLMDKGISFVDPAYGKPYGAPSVVKAALGEGRGLIEDLVYFEDEEGRHEKVSSPDDLRRIRAIYIEKDISALPEKEREILTSLKRLYERKGEDAPSMSVNLLGALKAILEKDSFGVPVGVKGEESGVYETLRNLNDVDRYVAIYLDKDSGALPPDEKEALSLIDSLRGAGIDFVDHPFKKRVLPMRILQVLKGEHPFDRTVWLLPEGELPRISNLEDLKRLDALVIRKDPSLLNNDEDRILLAMRELRDCGITFRGSHDKSAISVIKALKGELGIAFMVHPGGKESLIDDISDFDRIKALYREKDLAGLPSEEADVIRDVRYMQGEGYSCALAHGGKLQDVEPFDLLKSCIRNYPNVGLLDRDGAFSSVSSPSDLKSLKAIHNGEGPASLTVDEAKFFDKIRYLVSKGYTFKARLEFWPQQAPVLSSPESSEYRIGPLHALKELKRGNKNLWAQKDGETIALSKLADAMGFFEDIGVSGDDVRIAPPEKTIIEGDDFIVVGGVRLQVR